MPAKRCSLPSAVQRIDAKLDEGMWTYDNPPLKLLKEKFGFTPTQEWLDNLRLASVRFNDGGSGSFVSPNGLVLTNHHVAAGQLAKLSTKERDLLATGYYADKPEKELKCADLELNVLVSMENVTERVLNAAKGAATPQEALRARNAEIEKIQKESTEKTGLRSDVVDLYRGGEYWLYRYKKYTDVRLVFAPEKQIAYFGGDYDNFTYPRFDLDCTFFRVYENGKPVKPQRYLKWNNAGPQENELVFVSGHPGSTNRLNTYAQFEFNRDYFYPVRLKRFAKILQILREFGSRSDEAKRRAQDL
ncbi:MAG: S46 family peptidase, partial [Bacteroidota bacterium]|nr:S46 family peptidase [Bacteroidota bacterium]